jgi:hypothetical protein
VQNTCRYVKLGSSTTLNPKPFSSAIAAALLYNMMFVNDKFEAGTDSSMTRGALFRYLFSTVNKDINTSIGLLTKIEPDTSAMKSIFC